MDPDLLAALDALRAMRLAAKNTFWRYADACTKQDEPLSRTLDKEREINNRLADEAMEAFLKVLDR